jgi:hypothetical protein
VFHFWKELWYWKNGLKWMVVMVMEAKTRVLLSSVSVYECAIGVLEGIVCFVLSLRTFSTVGRCILCFHFFVACVSDQVRCRYFKMFSNPFNELSSLPQNAGKFCGLE